MDHHQSDLAGAAVPISKAVRRRRVCSTLLAVIAIWTAVIAIWTAESVRRSCDVEDSAAGTVLGGRGSLRSNDEDAAVLATAIVGFDPRMPSSMRSFAKARI